MTLKRSPDHKEKLLSENFIIEVLKRPLFYISSVMVMFGMVGIAEQIAKPGYTGRLGPIHGEHSVAGPIIVCAVITLAGLVLLYFMTRKIGCKR